MPDARPVDSRGKGGEVHKELPPYSPADRGRKCRQQFTVVDVERASARNRLRDEERPADRAKAFLFLPGQWRGRCDAPLRDLFGVPPLAASRTEANQVPGAVPEGATAVVLDEEFPFAGGHPIDRAVWPVLEDANLAVSEPALQPQTFGSKKGLRPVAAREPAKTIGSSLNKIHAACKSQERGGERRRDTHPPKV